MSIGSTLRATFSFAIGVLAILVLLEGAFRVLPTMSGLQPTMEPQDWPLRNYDAARPYQYSAGWAMLNAHRGTTNNYGHIAPFDFQPRSRPLIVVGDSYIESLMNDYTDTLQGVLGARLGAERPVYGIGVSALSASDYVVLARRARDEFNPAAAVFLITDGDMVESFERRPGGYHLERRGAALEPEYRPLSPSPAMEWVRGHVGRIALYDYVRGNLKFSPGDVLAALRTAGQGSLSPRSAPKASAAGLPVVEWFLSELPGASGIAPECTVLLLDSDRYAIYEPGAAAEPKDAPEVRALIIERGTALGFRVVDLGPVFAAEYDRTRLKLDYWPVDRHWNRHGHSVAANAVMAALFADGASARCAPGHAEVTSSSTAP